MVITQIKFHPKLALVLNHITDEKDSRVTDVHMDSVITVL